MSIAKFSDAQECSKINANTPYAIFFKSLEIVIVRGAEDIALKNRMGYEMQALYLNGREMYSRAKMPLNGGVELPFAHSWKMTDDDCSQWAKRVGDDSFQLYQVVGPTEDTYRVVYDTICVSDSSEDEIEEILRTFEYGDEEHAAREQVDDYYGDMALQIIAECIFEETCYCKAKTMYSCESFEKAKRFIEDAVMLDTNATFAKLGKLYHATFVENIPSICEKGLLRNPPTQRAWPDSDGDFVYLHTNKDAAVSYCEASESVPEEWCKIQVVEIDWFDLDWSEIRSDGEILDNNELMERSYQYAADIPASAVNVLPEIF